MTVLSMKPRPKVAEQGATIWQIWRGRIVIVLGRVAGKLRLPGLVRDAEIQDPITGQHVSIAVGPLFTRITVDGRDYYFRRFSGRLDGAGSASC